MTFKRQLVPLARLRLNNENDRHGPVPSEHEALGWLLTHHRDEMVNLAQDLAQFGLSPIESILVLPAGNDASGEFVVWEGNRRVAALKLLDDSNRAHDGTLRRRFTEIFGKAQVPVPDTIECVVAPSAEVADRLIELRHQGPQEGVGTLPWNPQQKERHQQRLGKRGRYALTQDVVDAFRDKLDPDLQERIRSPRFAYSTVDRILKNAGARKFLGLSTDGGVLKRTLDERETLKGLTKILSDVADGMPVGDVYRSKQIDEYLNGFGKKNRPNRKKALAAPVSLATSGEVPVTRTTARSRPLDRNRKRLIPAGISYRILRGRVNTIYHELRSLNVEANRNAVAVLFRVFLELSVDLYLDRHKILYQDREKLAHKTGRVVADLQKNGSLDRKGAKGINAAISSTHKPHAIDTFHSYVHSYQYQPGPSDLNAAFDNLESFFAALFKSLK
jgi:hypothetical protein